MKNIEREQTVIRAAFTKLMESLPNDAQVRRVTVTLVRPQKGQPAMAHACARITYLASAITVDAEPDTCVDEAVDEAFPWRYKKATANANA